jgi:hypothetical protein
LVWKSLPIRAIREIRDFHFGEFFSLKTAVKEQASEGNH